MGKVTVINKSRKECTCNKCRKVIPVGSKYFRGELNFARPIIRCADCGLQSWEVTTSDYQLSVGAIVYRWQEDYSVDMYGLSDIISSLEEIRDDLQSRLDNMPEGLQEGEIGTLLQDRIDSLDSAIDELNDIDEDYIKEEVVDEYETPYDSEKSSEDDENDSEVEWDDDNEDMQSAFTEKLQDAIEEALSNIEI